MVIHESAENYLETILMLKNRLGSVRSVDVAAELGFKKSSVSVAMKHFRENGYITVEKGGAIELTASGTALAEKIFERHRVIEAMLQSLGVSERTAAEDACRIEHALSDESFQCMKNHFEMRLRATREENKEERR